MSLMLHHIAFDNKGKMLFSSFSGLKTRACSKIYLKAQSQTSSEEKSGKVCTRNRYTQESSTRDELTIKHILRQGLV